METRHVKILDPDNEAVIDLWLTDQYPADLWTRAFRGRNLGLELSDDERTKAMKKVRGRARVLDEDAGRPKRRRSRSFRGAEG